MKEQLVEILNLIKENSKREHELYKLGIDLINFSDPYAKIYETFFEVLFDEGGCELIGWWLYENGTIVKDNDKRINLKKVENFVDYLIKNHKKEI